MVLSCCALCVVSVLSCFAFCVCLVLSCLAFCVCLVLSCCALCVCLLLFGWFVGVLWLVCWLVVGVVLLRFGCVFGLLWVVFYLLYTCFTLDLYMRAYSRCWFVGLLLLVGWCVVVGWLVCCCWLVDWLMLVCGRCLDAGKVWCVGTSDLRFVVQLCAFALSALRFGAAYFGSLRLRGSASGLITTPRTAHRISSWSLVF